jgi:hypothetical protein
MYYSENRENKEKLEFSEDESKGVNIRVKEGLKEINRVSRCYR